MSVIASHCRTTQSGCRSRTRSPDLLAEDARRWRRTAAPPSGRRRCPGALRAPGYVVDAVPAVDAVDRAEHLAVRPPVAAEEQQDRQHDRDDDALRARRGGSTPALATSETATALRRTCQVAAQDPRSISESAATMTTAASAVCGRSASSELRNSSRTTTSPAPTTPVSWLFAPDCSATAVREPLVETAKPWKNPAAMFAAPMPIISWSGSTSSPRRAAKLVEVAIVSVSETSVMPTAAMSSGHDVARLRPRERSASGRPAAARRPSRRRRPPEPSTAESDRRADHGDEDGGHAAS